MRVASSVLRFVAFSPLARGFLTGAIADPGIFGREGSAPHDAALPGAALRSQSAGCWIGFASLAREAQCTKAQLALAWLLRKAPHVIPIVGTTSVAHLTEDLGAVRGRDLRMIC